MRDMLRSHITGEYVDTSIIALVDAMALAGLTVQESSAGSVTYVRFVGSAQSAGRVADFANEIYGEHRGRMNSSGSWVVDLMVGDNPSLLAAVVLQLVPTGRFAYQMGIFGELTPLEATLV